MLYFIHLHTQNATDLLQPVAPSGLKDRGSTGHDRGSTGAGTQPDRGRTSCSGRPACAPTAAGTRVERVLC